MGSTVEATAGSTPSPHANLQRGGQGCRRGSGGKGDQQRFGDGAEEAGGAHAAQSRHQWGVDQQHLRHDAQHHARRQPAHIGKDRHAEFGHRIADQGQHAKG
jgi:hypothetical protein